MVVTQRKAVLCPKCHAPFNPRKHDHQVEDIETDRVTLKIMCPCENQYTARFYHSEQH